MPRREVHASVGVLAGALAAGVSAHNTGGDQFAVEVLGGLIGGFAGGVAPDVLEPAEDPNHRKLAHSLVAGGALTLARVSEWQARCRSAAETASVRAQEHLPGTRERSRAEWELLFWRAVAGALIGFAAGYASHLALDSLTPRGLPVLGV